MHAAAILLAGLVGFLKGQLHAHSNRSGDGTTPPAEVARWYRQHGYDFVVFTDHERITAEPSVGLPLLLPGVELTQNLETCEPPPRPGLACLLHVNALIVDETPAAIPWSAPTSTQRLALYERALVVTRALGGIAQLNHPNFHFAADGVLVKQLAARGLVLMEIANGSSDVNNRPPGEPSTEAIWDEVLSAGGAVFGTATDDAHHFFDAAERRRGGQPVYEGDVGFVMVRAQANAASIKRALARGDFYSSSGVLLRRVELTPRLLVIEVAAQSPGAHRFTFIGAHGRTLATRTGRAARFVPSTSGSSYVRVVVEDSRGRRAWTQPVFVNP